MSPQSPVAARTVHTDELGARQEVTAHGAGLWLQCPGREDSRNHRVMAVNHVPWVKTRPAVLQALTRHKACPAAARRGRPRGCDRLA